METLFSDKETFTKERPVRLPEKQETEFYLKMAKEVIDNGWGKYKDIDEIVEDLRELSSWKNGFELAQELDRNCGYDIDEEFVMWLGDLDDEKNQALNKIVELWVSIQNPQQKFQKGARLIINTDLNSLKELRKDNVIYVTGIRERTACYLVHDNSEHNGGYVFAFEKIEMCCSLFEVGV